MRRARLVVVLVLVTGLLAAACSREASVDDAGPGDAGGDGPGIHDAGVPDLGADASTACTTAGVARCSGHVLERCDGTSWTTERTCDAMCDEALGCIDCDPAMARMCVGGNVRACTGEGTIGGVVETCDASTPCIDGYCGGCAADTDLVYLIDTGARLHSFDPRTLALTAIGVVSCPGVASGASPYSMAVDRRGRAWVVFDDGELFWVDVSDASCTASGFVPDQDHFHTFGMGFVAESRGGPETLYVAGGPSIDTAVTGTRLATIDTATLHVHAIAPLTVLDAYYPELTGDGAGGLFGYFPSTTYPSRVSVIRRDTARIATTWDTVRLDSTMSTSAWAVARWGGKFYLFLAISDVFFPIPSQTEIYVLDPATGGVRFLRTDFHTFVGAGVSTCAPVLI